MADRRRWCSPGNPRFESPRRMSANALVARFSASQVSKARRLPLLASFQRIGGGGGPVQPGARVHHRSPAGVLYTVCVLRWHRCHRRLLTSMDTVRACTASGPAVDPGSARGVAGTSASSYSVTACRWTRCFVDHATSWLNPICTTAMWAPGWRPASSWPGMVTAATRFQFTPVHGSGVAQQQPAAVGRGPSAKGQALDPMGGSITLSCGRVTLPPAPRRPRVPSTRPVTAGGRAASIASAMADADLHRRQSARRRYCCLRSSAAPGLAVAGGPAGAGMVGQGNGCSRPA